MSTSNQRFAEQLFSFHQKHRVQNTLREPAEILSNELLSTMFPHHSSSSVASPGEVEDRLDQIAHVLTSTVRSLERKLKQPVNEIVTSFMGRLPEIHSDLLQDAEAIYNGDPAATDIDEVILTYPGFFAVAIYRIAHELRNLGVPYFPRALTEYAHSVTGIDIHPGAEIAPGFCIDHGTGIVIGETSVIGRNVRIYQGVTLGGTIVRKEMQGKKRHPTIEDDVVIYANATILGGDTVIGARSIIGGNVSLSGSVPPDSLVSFDCDARARTQRRNSH